MKGHFDFIDHLEKKIEWSRKTFGSGTRHVGIINHIRKECDEVLDNPKCLEEWVDILILALDGAWRSGASPQDIVDMLVSKTTKNMERRWPDWRTMTEDEPIEHVRD